MFVRLFTEHAITASSYSQVPHLIFAVQAMPFVIICVRQLQCLARGMNFFVFEMKSSLASGGSRVMKAITESERWLLV